MNFNNSAKQSGPSGPSGPNGPSGTQDHLVLIDCYYYSFYIKKSELDKYIIPRSIPRSIPQSTLPEHFTIDIKEPSTKINNEVNNLFNFSNVLNKYKALEKLILTKTISTLYLFKNYIF